MGDSHLTTVPTDPYMVPPPRSPLYLFYLAEEKDLGRQLDKLDGLARLARWAFLGWWEDPNEPVEEDAALFGELLEGVLVEASHARRLYHAQVPERKVSEEGRP